VPDLCQFLDGGWKVLLGVKQHSRPVFTVRNRGGGVICQKDIPDKVERSKNGKKRFFEKI
jgi:hypothetical protein